MKKEKWYDKIAKSNFTYIAIAAISLLFIVISYVFFQNGRPFDTHQRIDEGVWGTFGDFVGGVLGTLLSVISLFFIVITFKHQHKVTKQNHLQMEKQRFNDLIFELLHLYQSQIADLSSEEISYKNGKIIKRIRCTNKDFFSLEKSLLQRAFVCTTSYRSNKDMALNLYMLFYVKKNEVSSCFRTLYRIYDLIDASDLDEKTKKNYLKVVRAQLTESELFFLRYNAMSFYGNNFVKYLNKYNVLKHLPLFDLLEMKDFWAQMTDVERTGINIIFNASIKLIKCRLKGISSFMFEKDRNNRYDYNIRVENNDVEIIMHIDRHLNVNYNEYKGFDKLNDGKIQALLDCFLKEVFIFGNFGEFNKEDNLIFYSNPIIYTPSGKVIINSGVKTKDTNPLVLEYSQEIVY